MPPGNSQASKAHTPFGRSGLLLALFYAATVLVISFTAYQLFQRERAAIVAATERQLSAVARLKADMISDWLDERQWDANGLALLPAFVTAARQWLTPESRSEEARRYIYSHLQGRVAGSQRYESVSLIDRDGAIRFSVGEKVALPGLVGSAAREAIRTGRPAIVSFTKAVPVQPVRFIYAVPLAQRGDSFAALAFVIDPYLFFFPHIMEREDPYPEVTNLLVAPEGEAVRILTRHPGEPDSFTVPLSSGIVAAYALERNSRVIEGLDFRGVEVVAAIRPVPGTPWSLVARVDESTIVAPIRSAALQVALAALLLILLTGALARLWYGKQRAALAARASQERLDRERAERSFDFLARYANDMIITVDQEDRVLDVNERAVEVYGYTRDEFIGKPIRELRAPEALPLFEKQWSGLKAQGEGRYETWHQRKDGSHFPVEVSGRVIEVAPGNRVYQSILRDISERKAAERRYERLMNLYRTLSRTNEVIVRSTERDPLFREICATAVRFGFISAWVGLLNARRNLIPVVHDGIPPEQLIDNHFDLLDRPGVGPMGIALREGRIAFCNDVQGEALTAAWHEEARKVGVGSAASLPLRKGGQLVGVFSVFAREPGFFDEQLLELLDEMSSDLSFALDNFSREERRRKVEQSLMESENRFRSLFEAMSSGVVVYSVQGGEIWVKDVNRAFEKIEGQRRDDVIGRSIYEMAPGVEEFGLDKVLRRVSRSGQAEHFPAAFYKDARHEGWRENYIYRLPSGEVVAVYDDITERVQAEQAVRASEERLRLVLEGTNDGFWDFDFASGEVYYSKRFLELFNIPPDEVDTSLRGWEKLVVPEDRPRVRAELEAHLRGETPQYRSEHRMVVRGGGWRWVLARGRVVRRNERGEPLRMAGTHADISQRKSAEEQLRLWAMVFEAAGEAIFITDPQRRIVSVNHAFTEITGFRLGEVAGRPPRLFEMEGADRSLYETMWATVAETGYWQGEVYDRRKDGRAFPSWLSITGVRGEQDSFTNLIGIFTDISARKAAEERIQFLAHHDFLTGMPNRVLLNERLEVAIARAERSGGRVAVLFVDLDRFKNVNDSLGHHKGDQLLRQLADRLRAEIRKDDTVSRHGGDEFIIALADVAEPADAALVAQKVIETIKAPFDLDGVVVHVTPSVGIAVFPEDGHTAQDLIRSADAAMYYAKERGRNNFQFFVPELNRRAMRRLTLEASLRRALERQEFQVYYQPQTQTATGKLVGVEALIRWIDNGRNLSPAEFIPVAEESGLIIPIGRWVLEEACRQQRRWVEEGLPNIPVAVNVSALQFRESSFRETVSQAVEGVGLDPHNLELELTEGILMQEAEASVRSLSELKEMGLMLSIDDFGTGYSSLSYLRRFPIDRLKVDQSFIRYMASDRADLAITEAIIALAKTLGLKVIAEGVETAEEIEMLRVRSCDDIQGFYVSHALPGDELREWYFAHSLHPHPSTGPGSDQDRRI